MIKKLSIFALAIALAAPAIAADAPIEKSFTRDGSTYVYTSVQKAGRIVLAGRRFPSGSAFTLVVRGNQITGVSDGVPVSFSIPDAQAKLTQAAFAAR